MKKSFKLSELVALVGLTIFAVGCILSMVSIAFVPSEAGKLILECSGAAVAAGMVIAICSCGIDDREWRAKR